MSNGASPLPPTLGGQAVVEGVMIRGPKGTAVCVRKPDGEIVSRTERAGLGGGALRHIPVLRGVATLGDTMTQGMRAMLWSAQIAAGMEPEEPDEKSLRTTMALSIAAISALFMLAPAAATRRIERRIRNPRLAAVVEGVARVGMLVGYLRTIGRLPQAQRLFGYHGAEHRAIQAYEAGEPLEVESLYQFPNAHVRCGTSFLLTTTLVSSLMFAALGPQTMRKRLLSRIVLLPLVAGLSYEAIRFGHSQRSGPLRLLFGPNMALQALTTRDPDEPQMEVALAAVRAALELHASA